MTLNIGDTVTCTANIGTLYAGDYNETTFNLTGVGEQSQATLSSSQTLKVTINNPYPELTITKTRNSTNVLHYNDSATWTYTVLNNSFISIYNISVTDDAGTVITCPKTTLLPQESMTCSGTSNVQ